MKKWAPECRSGWAAWAGLRNASTGFNTDILLDTDDDNFDANSDTSTDWYDERFFEMAINEEETAQKILDLKIQKMETATAVKIAKLDARTQVKLQRMKMKAAVYAQRMDEEFRLR
ncbi:hypothetical protein DXG03_003670 [Asterophora parasitica]|uniref:Uncharacterized protein n=1 Tax=Asterophora parasitica TaxID=117018 RepID=A0A9P7GG50_9AGAR|nr:hypothetical protein DXG03_003670 [Asterophora parasitica]